MTETPADTMQFGSAVSIRVYSLELLNGSLFEQMLARKEERETLPKQPITALLLAAASSEAFLNEFCEYVPLIYQAHRVAMPPALASCVDILNDLEGSRISVTTKYLYASRVLGDKGFNAGQNPYQDFRLLVDLRNAIMHMRVARDNVARRATDVLIGRGLARPAIAPTLSWFDCLKTSAVAQWAHESAFALIVSFLQMVPAPEPIDPLLGYRSYFSRPKTA